jgi:hypothetical protein
MVLQSCKQVAEAPDHGAGSKPPERAMKKSLLVTLLLTFGVVAAGANGRPRVSIRVSPAVAFAPALLTVRTTIEPSDENRVLSIQVDSPAYRRISEIQLDGKNAQRTNVLELKDVPTGLYEVRAVLVGPSGPLATTMQLVKVEPAAGYTR